MMDMESPRLSFNFVDEAEPEQHRVDAELLAEALLHGQRAVHLLALKAAGREFRGRLRIPTDLANEFRLICEPPTAGSYAQPVVLAGTGAVLDVPSRHDVLREFSEVGAALSHGAWDDLRDLLPDQLIRERVVEEYISLLPDPDSGVGLDVYGEGDIYARFRRPQILAVHEYRKSIRARDLTSQPARIIGEVISIDFAAHTIAIRHYSTNRRVVCEYTEDVEELLLKNRRGLVQVTGVLELDKRDRPVRMTDVYEISEVDLSPIVMSVIEGPSRKFRFRQGSHAFVPYLDSEGQLFVVEDEVLDLHVYARTRSELISEIAEQMEFLWVEYVDTSDKLTPGAADLARRLRLILEPVVDA